MEFKNSKNYADITCNPKYNHMEHLLCFKISNSQNFFLYLTRGHNLDIITYKCLLVLDVVIVK